MDKSAGKKPLVTLSLFDRAVSAISPSAGLKRIRAKAIVASMQSMGFISGKKQKISMRGWETANRDADTDLLEDLEKQRERSRDLFTTTPIATGCLKRTKTNVIGSGLRLQCRILRETLFPGDNDAADAWERNTEERFNAWASSPDCDLTRTQNFYELQGLAFFSALLSGDSFTLLPRKGINTLDSTLRIALFEADFVSNPQWGMDTDKLSGGVEMDDDGAPVAYHFSDKHPGNGRSYIREWKRIPAFGPESGRRQVIQLFSRERPGQRRGAVMLAPVMESLKQLGRYADSELMAAVIQSFFTVFIKQEVKAADPMKEGLAVSEKLTNQTVEADKNIYEMGSGNIIGLGENEGIEMAAPSRPNSAFSDFFKAFVRQIGSALEIPYEVVILHFESSYSASRAALLEAWKFFKDRRQFVAQNWTQPIYEEWLYEEILNGRILAPGYFNNNFTRYAWSKTAWQGRGQGQIDPVKETKGAMLKLESNLSTYEDEYTLISEGDWTGAMLRKERETTFLKAKKLWVEPKPAAGAPGQGGDGGAGGGQEGEE